MPNSLYVHQVCKRGEGPLECRYSTMLPDRPGQFSCARLNPAAKDRIDDLVANGSRTVVGRAVNCEGKS